MYKAFVSPRSPAYWNKGTTISSTLKPTATRATTVISAWRQDDCRIDSLPVSAVALKCTLFTDLKHGSCHLVHLFSRYYTWGRSSQLNSVTKEVAVKILKNLKVHSHLGPQFSFASSSLLGSETSLMMAESSCSCLSCTPGSPFSFPSTACSSWWLHSGISATNRTSLDTTSNVLYFLQAKFRQQ